MIIKESTLRSRIRSLLLEERVYKIKELLEDIEFYRDFKEGELEQVEQRLRGNWDRGYSKYSQVIKRDVINSEEPISHILDAIDSFMPYYSKVGPQMQSKIGRGELTSSNLRSYIEGQASDKLNRTRTDQRIKCRKQVPIREGQECKDFKVIHADNDWVVVYPKTMLGSMSWAVGLADGSEEVYEVDSNGRQAGRVGWCTAAYTNNRFPMYAGNLHMYYFVKNDGYDISDRYRRLCITWSKNENTGEVQIQHKGNATVDANNADLPEKRMSGLISSKIIEKMRADASSRKSTSLSDVASKVTLPMVKQDIENLKDDPGLLIQQLQVYAKYAKDIDVIRFFASYENVSVRLSILRRNNLPESIIESIIRLFAQDESPLFRSHIANRRVLPEDLVVQLAQDENVNVRQDIARRSDLSEDLIVQLARDKSEDVRSTIANNNNLDLSKDLVKQLAQDESELVRNSITMRKDLPGDLITTLLKNSSTPGNIIKNYDLKKSLVDEELSKYIDNDASNLSDRKVLKDVVKNEHIELLLANQSISDKDLISLYNKASLPLQYMILARKDLPSILKLKYRPEMFTKDHLEEKFGKYYIYNEEEDINLIVELLALSRYVNPEVLDNIIYFDLFGDNVGMYDNKGFEIAPAIVRNENATPQLKKKILDHFNEVFNNFTDYYGPIIILDMKKYLEEFLTKNYPEMMRESRLLKSYINLLLN